MHLTFEDDLIRVSVNYDEEKVLDSIYINGEIVKFEKPIKGSYCVEARPKEEGAYIEGIGLCSVSYELTEIDAVRRALKYFA